MALDGRSAGNAVAVNKRVRLGLRRTLKLPENGALVVAPNVNLILRPQLIFRAA
jgi:hypothetical protein